MISTKLEFETKNLICKVPILSIGLAQDSSWLPKHEKFACRVSWLSAGGDLGLEFPHKLLAVKNEEFSDAFLIEWTFHGTKKCL